MERGALGSELDGNPAERRVIWSREDSRFPDVFTSSTPFSNYKHCGMLSLEYSPCTAVMKKSNTSYSSLFLSRSVLSCMKIPVAFSALEVDVIFSGRAVYANSCIYGKC